MDKLSYWEECLAYALEERGIKVTDDDLKYIAEAVEGAHDNYGRAFYSPPSSERLNDIKNEYVGKLKEKEKEYEKYVRNAEMQ
jgi:hypothetical protein